MLLNNYDQITEEHIRALTHEELIQAVLRLLRTEEIQCEDWLGPGLIPDHLADAFRDRN